MGKAKLKSIWNKQNGKLLHHKSDFLSSNPISKMTNQALCTQCTIQSIIDYTSGPRIKMQQNCPPLLITLRD